MNKFLSISLVMLCGVSVLATPNAGFAVKFGEDKEMDRKWTTATLKLGEEIDDLVRDQGTAEQKLNFLTILGFPDRFKTISVCLEKKYEPAQLLKETFEYDAERIASWIYPTFNEKTKRDDLIKQLLKNPTSLQAPEDNEIFVNDFGGLKISTAVPDALVNEWKSTHDLFLENYKTDREMAQFALEQLMGLAGTVPAAKTWLEHSVEVVQFQTPNNGKMEELLETHDLNYQNFMNSPNAKVQFHKDREALSKKLKPILDELIKLHQNADVHLLDKFYAANANNLIEIAKAIFPENGKLTLEEVKANLKKLINEHPELLTKYDYEKKAFTKEAMFKYIDDAYQKDMPVELCSYAYELAIQILNSTYKSDDFGIYRVFDAVVENYETKGGCLQGRRNRQFGALASMLASCGLDK